MNTNEKLALKTRTLKRQSRKHKKAAAARAKTDAIARTMCRTPVQVHRLVGVVNTKEIINARKEHDENIDLTKRNKRGQFRKGSAPTKIHRRKGRNPFSIHALREALRNVEHEVDKVPIFEHFVRRAYENDNVLKSLMSKILPDLKSIDAKIIQKTPFRLIIDLSDRPQIPMLSAPGAEDDE